MQVDWEDLGQLLLEDTQVLYVAALTSENCWSAREDRSAVLGLRHWVGRKSPNWKSSQLHWPGKSSGPNTTSLKRVKGRAFWHQSSSFYKYSQAVTLISIFKRFLFSTYKCILFQVSKIHTTGSFTRNVFFYFFFAQAGKLHES